MDYFLNLNPFIQTLIATLFTFSITALGASLVFFFKKINKNIFDSMLGISAGIMLAAAFFSLLIPAIKMSDNLNMTVWLVLFIGFTLGSFLLFIIDKIFSKILSKVSKKGSLKRSLMLIISIILHNVPEGMSIGVAFGSTIYNIDGATAYSALMLALGIGIQNFPEGSAISLPLRREGYSRKFAFLIGCLSGITEIIAGIIGLFLVLKIRVLLPYLLSFASGAMIYVVIEELIPESQTNDKKDLIALFTMIGFSIMMILDIALG